MEDGGNVADPELAVVINYKSKNVGEVLTADDRDYLNGFILQCVEDGIGATNASEIAWLY